jgi:CarD family transcriptional regulator
VALPTSPSNFNLGAILQFEIGDKVIYPNHGLGVIERIEDKTILGTTCGFYSLRMATSDTTVLVPVDNVSDVGLRRAIGDHEVKKIFTLLGNGKIENHQNWKGRFKDNSDKMRTGSIYDVIDVLKSLNHLSQSKNLSFREKRMLDRSKFLVVSEISEVMNESDEAVEERVGKALERCLVNRIRLLEKAKMAKKKTAKAKRASKKTSSRAAPSRTAAAS